jgi:hypothetical protein
LAGRWSFTGARIQSVRVPAPSGVTIRQQITLQHGGKLEFSSFPGEEKGVFYNGGFADIFPTIYSTKYKFTFSGFLKQ